MNSKPKHHLWIRFFRSKSISGSLAGGQSRKIEFDSDLEGLEGSNDL